MFECLARIFNILKASDCVRGGEESLREWVDTSQVQVFGKRCHKTLSAQSRHTANARDICKYAHLNIYAR